MIMGTVAIYGLGAAPAARWFRVVRGPAQTVVLVDPRPWALRLAEALISADVEVMLVTTDEERIAAAAERSIRTFDVRVDSEEFEDAMDSAGIAKAVVLSGSDEMNTLWTARLADAIGRANVFHLPVGSDGDGDGEDHGYGDTVGRRAFAPDADQHQIEATLAAGGKFVVVGATDHDTDLLADALPLVEVSDTGDPVVLSGGGPPPDKPGHWLIALSPA